MYSKDEYIIYYKNKNREFVGNVGNGSYNFNPFWQTWAMLSIKKILFWEPRHHEIFLDFLKILLDYFQSPYNPL